MGDIVDQLQENMEEPDIVELLFQSVEEAFHKRYPDSQVTLSSTENPDQLHVTVLPSVHVPLKYSMAMSDEWEDQPDFRFTFTNTEDSNDKIEVDIAS